MSEPTLLANLLENPETPRASAARAHENHASSLPTSWVERIFAVMAAHYGARFADAWRGVDAAEMKAAWARKLAGLTPQQIKRGLAGLEQCRFPPTLPEFMALCRQAMPEAHVLKLPAPRLTPEQREQGRRRFAELKRKLGWTA